MRNHDEEEGTEQLKRSGEDEIPKPHSSDLNSRPVTKSKWIRVTDWILHNKPRLGVVFWLFQSLGGLVVTTVLPLFQFFLE